MGPEVGPAFQRRSWDTVPFRLGVRLADTGSSHVDSNVDLEIPAFTPRSEPPHARAPGAQTIRMATGTTIFLGIRSGTAWAWAPAQCTPCDSRDGMAAPQAPPGRRMEKMQRRRRCQEQEHAQPHKAMCCYAMFCHVLLCFVLCWFILFFPVLFCSVLFWASLTNPTELTQTNTTPPQHHTTEPSGDQKNAIRHRGRRGKSGRTSAQGVGGIDNRRRRRREK
eukprot:gene21581-biopygen13207